MIIDDLLLQTLPSDRLYEYNLNWILKKIDEYDKGLQDTIINFLTKNLSVDLSLEYSAIDESVKLTYSVEGGEMVNE